MSTLQGALPDATEEELLAYDDDCAICKAIFLFMHVVFDSLCVATILNSAFELP